MKTKHNPRHSFSTLWVSSANEKFKVACLLFCVWVSSLLFTDY